MISELLHQLYNSVVTSVTKIKSKISQQNSKLIQTGGMGADLIKYIQDADAQTAALHDIKIKIESNLHRYLLQRGNAKNNKNHSIQIAIPNDNPYITARALVYPKTIFIDIGCTLKPFNDDILGHKQLASFLNQIHQYLCKSSDHKAIIPEPQYWILTHYHYGKDGQMEYNGEKFHITARDTLGDYIRAYSKHLLDGSVIVRIEKVRTPKITVKSFLRSGDNVK